MNSNTVKRSPSSSMRQRLLDAAISIIRKKGYTATTIDDLCAEAGATKGAFFHHFPTKDFMAAEAAEHWSKMSDTLFSTAPYNQLDDPLDRVLGYIELRKSLLRGDVGEFSCLVGTMVQEVYATHPDIRQACNASINVQITKLESDIAEAMKRYRIHASWTAKSLSLHANAVLQGAFVLAKARGGASAAVASVDHLRRYIELLFGRSGTRAKRKPLKRTRSQ